MQTKRQWLPSSDSPKNREEGRGEKCQTGLAGGSTCSKAEHSWNMQPQFNVLFLVTISCITDKLSPLFPLNYSKKPLTIFWINSIEVKSSLVFLFLIFRRPTNIIKCLNCRNVAKNYYNLNCYRLQRKP